MKSIDEIVKPAYKRTPRKIVVYGPPGTGKTTFASQAEKVVFIPTEDGLSDIEGAMAFPQPKQAGQLSAYVARLQEGDHDFKTVCIDSLDAAEHLFETRVCAANGVDVVSEIPFGKGGDKVAGEFKKLLKDLDVLHDMGMEIILIGHSQTTKFECPMRNAAYDMYSLRLHKKVSPLITEWATEVFFVKQDEQIEKIDAGFGRERAVASSATGESVMYTAQRPAFVAKNRLNLPFKLPLKFDAYRKHRDQFYSQAKESVTDASN